MNVLRNRKQVFSVLAKAAVLSFSAAFLTSCVVKGRGVYGPPHYHKHHPVVVEPAVEILPAGARVVWVRGQKYWVNQGLYYRPHPRGHGFVRVDVSY